MASIRKVKNSWSVAIRRRGFPHQYGSFDTRADAKAWADEVEAQMRRGRYADLKAAERTTLGEALDRYVIEISSGKKGGKIESYRRNTINRHSIAKYSLVNITGQRLTEYRNQRLKVAAPNTVNNELILISHLYTIARKEWGMIGLHNPVEDVTRPKKSKGRDRRISVLEEQALISAAKSIDMEAVIILAIETGMRRGEIATLGREQIVNNIVHLTNTKNSDDRDVPLSSRAIAAIRRLPTRLDGRLVGLNADSISHNFRAIADSAGLPDIKFHDARHEATSRLFERGLDIAEVAAITGHKTWSMLRRYTHLKASDLVKKLS